MPYFKTLIAVGQLGFWTFAITSAIALHQRWGWKGVGIGVGCGVTVGMCIGPSMWCCEVLMVVRLVRLKLSRMQRVPDAVNVQQATVAQ